LHPIPAARLRPRSTHRSSLRGGASLLTAALLVAAVALPAAAQDEPTIFDSSTVHAISVTFDETDYDAMIAAFQETGDKGWIEATVTIDGVTYEDVGMRLKGNSSLMALRGTRGFPGAPGAEVPDSDAATSAEPGASADPGASAEPDAVQPDVLMGGPAGFGGPGGDVSADEPEGLPWLIRLDKNVDGQSLDGGITDIVVRSNRSETSLNEAVALELLEAAGLASQAAAPTSFSVNGSDPTLRLIIENPDDTWMAASFEGEGALYKAESTGDWAYRGDDPDDYDEIFDQEAGKDVTDLAPLLAFLQFINEADDATFAAELPDRLDVDAFATYLAMMDLVDNFDDIDGPGNNAYLHWDAATAMFTIVPWDMNLAFGGLGGGRGFGPGGDGGARPPRMDPTASGDPDAGTGERPTRPDGMPDGGRFDRTNPLVERFHAVPELEAVYQAKLTELRAQLYDSGLAQQILDRWTGVLGTQAADLVDVATIEQEATSIAEHFTGA
jgi:spore coat protein CotH